MTSRVVEWPHRFSRVRKPTAASPVAPPSPGAPACGVDPSVNDVAGIGSDVWRRCSMISGGSERRLADIREYAQLIVDVGEQYSNPPRMPRGQTRHTHLPARHRCERHLA